MLRGNQPGNCQTEHAERAGNAELNYQITDCEELQAVIYDNLEAEYNYVMELQKTYGTLVAPKMSFFMTLSPAQYIVKMHHPVSERAKHF